MSKFSKLREMELKRYLEVNGATDNWKDYSIKQKLAFVQQSFDDLNEYICLQNGLNPRDTKFGFCTGLNVSGKYLTNERAVVMPFKLAGYYFTPQQIDKTLRHELRHMVQYNGKQQFDTKMLYLPNSNYDRRLHFATPIEFDADSYAYKEQMKSSFCGILKSDKKMCAVKDFCESSKKYIGLVFEHSKSKYWYEHSYLKQQKTSIQNGKEQKEDSNQATKTFNNIFDQRVYSLGQLTRLIDNNPEQFKDEKEGKKILDEYGNSNLPKNYIFAFFGKFVDGKRVGNVVFKGQHISQFDRYNENGNLIDEEDKNAEYDLYTPQEVLGYEFIEDKEANLETENSDEITKNNETKINSTENSSKDTDEGAQPPIG